MSQSLLLGGGGASLWVSGMTYAQGRQVVSPSDSLIYIRRVAGAGAIDPSNDAANWRQASASSRWITNPKHMPLAAFASTDMNLKNSSASVQLSSVAGFYTSLALRGASSAITVAATLVTVVNVTSGSGFLVNLISPTHTASFTPTFIVTIDGVAYTISPSATIAANRRLVLGPVVYGIPSTTAIGSAALVDHFHDSNSVADAGFNAALSGGVPSTSGMTCGIPTPEAVINFGLPALRFEHSLKVEMMASLLSANAVDKQCGATYRLDL